jgi:hypothetical protein
VTVAPDFRSVLGPRSVLGGPPGRDSTRADHFDHLEAGLTPLACGHCGAVVRVKKNSPKHTSIQWTRSAEQTCPNLAARLGGAGQGIAEGCDRLREEIAAAAEDGRVPTGDSSINGTRHG